MDTIFAQATASGKAGISVIRVSGPEANSAQLALCGRGIPPRVASLVWLADPATGLKIDQAIALRFPAPASFTGEDVVEFQLHGSPAVSRSILRLLGAQPGLRLAEPGEFTRRAILNGRLDITQAEGLGDLLAAETEEQRRLAFEVMEGRLSRQAEGWREALVDALSLIATTIDFSDEELPAEILSGLGVPLAAVERDMLRALDGSGAAERLRDGFEVAIVGPPNAGKSTLLNHIAGREVALTSTIPGTTRDVLELRVDLRGIPVTFLDTAGVRATEDEIESLGVARAVARAERADIRIFLTERDRRVYGFGLAARPEDLVVEGKGDLPGASAEAVSGLTGAGVAELLARIAAILSERVSRASLLSQERQRDAVERAARALSAALTGLKSENGEIELVAEELRAAVQALDYLVGRFDVEMVFDRIFRNFCLGK